MPRLMIQLPGAPVRSHPLVKTLTTVGSAPENDVVLPLRGVPESALHLELRGGEVRLFSHSGAELTVNGERRTEGPLPDRAEIALGGATLRLELLAPAPAPAGGDAQATLDALLAFCRKLTLRQDVQVVLEDLLDSAIALTDADKGFLMLVEDDRMAVRVARNVTGETPNASALSDSIVAAVSESGRPLLVHDALHDEKFSQSDSVVNLKLCSVMAVPLIEQGTLLGLLYLGNDRVAHQFEEHDLVALEIFAAQAALIVRGALLLKTLRHDSAELRRELERQRYGELIGSCPGMQEIFRRIEKVAATDVSVLIGGETGTGKEVLAREIHRRSARAKGPFIAVNCGAIPESLLESELFGHVRGAFTGAVATRQGRFQAAAGGTLFLDEVGDMPPSLQVKILRAIQERAVVKVGDTRPENVDIRIIAATNRVLEDEVAAGRFREDLFYRLNVVKLIVPPLRQRGDDVLVLAKLLLDRMAAEMKLPARGLAKDGIEALRRHTWPGNVRELENRLKKALVLSDRAKISAEDLDLTAGSLTPILPLADAKTKFQREYIDSALARNGGNRTKTARDLGVDARTIFRHLERLEAERQGRTLPRTEEDRELDG